MRTTIIQDTIRRRRVRRRCLQKKEIFHYISITLICSPFRMNYLANLIFIFVFAIYAQCLGMITMDELYKLGQRTSISPIRHDEMNHQPSTVKKKTIALHFM